MTASERTHASDLLVAVKKIEPVLRENVALGEATCRLPQATVDAVREAGLWRMWVPAALGGSEVDPVTAWRVIEEVARIDGAAGWNVANGNAGALLGAWLPDDGARHVFRADTILAGALFPPMQAVPVVGGYRITGRSPFVSGCLEATWFYAPVVVVDGGVPRTDEHGNPVSLIVFFPRSEAEVIDNWDTLGMRGTGSHDVAVDDRFVPEQFAGPFVPFTDDPPGRAYQGPLYRMVIWQAIAMLAAVPLGMARAAVEDLVALAGAKTPAYTASPLRERPGVQSQVAQAQAHVGAAVAYLHSALAGAWETCRTGAILTTEQRMTLQLAGCHGQQAAASAVRLVHTAAGTSAIRNAHRFAEYFRNVHTMNQHAFTSASRFESVGQLMLGLPPDWPFFAF